MLLRLTLRRWLSCGVVMAILFTQIATAAYVCPAMQRSDATAMGDMPCAEMMAAGVALDADQPGLCRLHCQFGTTHQPADPAQTLAVAQAAPLELFVLSPTVVPQVQAAPWAAHERSRDRAPPPTHAVLHCCYRI